MASMTEWLRKWRGIANALEEGIYESITVQRGDEIYEVLRVSIFDQEIDGGKHYVVTPSTDFEDQLAALSRRTRETGLTRVITAKGKPRFILEQGTDALEWMAAVEGVKLENLISATRNGSLWRSIARRVARGEKVKQRLLEAQVEELKEYAREAEYETQRLALELRSAEKELSRHGAE